jgi:hypothetical protein
MKSIIMQKIKTSCKYLAVAGCLLLLCISCRKDYLERVPSDFISSDEVFTNIDNAAAFLNDAYNTLPDFQRATEDGGGRYHLGTGTDEMGYQQSAFVTQTPYDFNTGNWNAVAFPMQHLWKDYYSAIRRINLFLENYDKIPEEVSSGVSGRKQRLKGEAYGLRAFFYFELFKMWGSVPLIKHSLDPNSGEDIYLPRAPVDEVIGFIKEDLNTAISLLPPKYQDNEYGRVTATIAKALLSRVTLYYASPLWNTGNDVSRWKEAAAAAKDALDFALQNGYALSTGSRNGVNAYERIFLELDNPEVIWARNNLDESESIWWNYYDFPLGNGGWYVQGPLQEMVDAYEMTNGELPVLGYNADGSQRVNPASGYNPQNPYVNRDPRFYQSILYTGAVWQGRTIDIKPGGGDNNTFGIPRVNYYCRKYGYEGHNLFTNAGNVYRRFALIRLAELYLNYAEAENEANEPGAAYTAIHTIRERAGMPDIPSGLSIADLRTRIQHERRIELAFEDHRFWDVRRWKIAETVDKGPVHKVMVDEHGTFTYPVFQNRVFDKTKHYLFPIPQSELDKNANLEQNPGW